MMLVLIGACLLVGGMILFISGLNMQSVNMAFFGILLAIIGPFFFVQSGFENDQKMQIECEQNGGAKIQDGPSSSGCYKIINDKMVKINL